MPADAKPVELTVAPATHASATAPSGDFHMAIDTLRGRGLIT